MVDAGYGTNIRISCITAEETAAKLTVGAKLIFVGPPNVLLANELPATAKFPVYEPTIRSLISNLGLALGLTIDPNPSTIK